MLLPFSRGRGEGGLLPVFFFAPFSFSHRVLKGVLREKRAKNINYSTGSVRLSTSKDARENDKLDERLFIVA